MKRITKLGLSFDKEASLYHAIRPNYPEELFDDLATNANLSPQAKILEIGPGTGQATKPLAKRNYELTGIEIGASLAAIARNELSQFNNVDIITGAFEDIELAPESFDLIFSAISFHWIKPGWKYRKPHQLLKPNGHLAIVHTHPISDGQGDTFFHASQPIYQKYFPRSNNLKSSLPLQSEIAPYEIDNQLFELSHFATFPMTHHYSGEKYRQLVNTYSPTLRLPLGKREAFLDDIQQLIETDFNNILQKYFAISLTIARKITE